MVGNATKNMKASLETIMKQVEQKVNKSMMTMERLLGNVEDELAEVEKRFGKGKQK